MRWVFLLIHDGRTDASGRQLHELTLESARGAFGCEPEQMLVVDDTEHELGFAGAIQDAWCQLRDRDRLLRAHGGSGFDYVFHCEGDFLFTRPVPVVRMMRVLEAHPHLAQLVLKRQPWAPEEEAAGGIVEMHPDEYEQVSRLGDTWTEHRLFWSTNPTLYPFGWAHHDWPQDAGSERAWTDILLRDPALRFAFWGPKFAPPAVLHIGDRRAGHGY